MRIGTFLEMARSGRLTAYPRIMRIVEHAYRLAFISTGFESGVLPAIAGGKGGMDELVKRFGEEHREALEAWLNVGVSIGELRCDREGYRIRGSLTRLLLEPENDDLLAVMQEVSSLHLRLLAETPERLEQGRPFTLADQDGVLVARSSESVAPLVHDAVARLIPSRGPFRLLEIGCGAGTHIRYASSINPELQTVALELQEDVAERARENLERWGLADRTEVVTSDVRDWKAGAPFDAATLHNNIYYFPVEDRVALLEHVRGFLRPGGRVLLTTGTRGGSPMMRVLDLWGAVTESCGRLPEREEILEQMARAGFVETRATRLVPGEAYFAFLGATPAS